MQKKKNHFGGDLGKKNQLFVLQNKIWHHSVPVPNEEWIKKHHLLKIEIILYYKFCILNFD
jgi:hypothetical protein